RERVQPLDAVERDADDARAGGGELLGAGRELVRLDVAARRVRRRIEVDDDRALRELVLEREGEGLAGERRRCGERRCRIAGLERSDRGGRGEEGEGGSSGAQSHGGLVEEAWVERRARHSARDRRRALRPRTMPFSLGAERMRGVDFSSWQGVVSTLLGLVVVSLVAVGIRLLVMQRVQRRRERENRQINERLKTLIAAYKTLGGSFTGDLAVDPSHLRDLRARAASTAAPSSQDDSAHDASHGDRRRRVRDAVEAALADVVLLGTEEQVRLAVRAADEMVAGRSVEIAELVVSLRTFIRDALDLEPVPPELVVPRQGPLRTIGAARGGGDRG